MTASQSWSSDQINTLRTMWADNATSYEIGLKVGKSRSAVSGKISRLELQKKGAPLVRSSFWNLCRETKFKKMWIDGISIDEIAAYFNITKSSIAHKRGRLKLIPRNRGGKNKSVTTVHNPYVAPKPKPTAKPVMVPVPLLERTGCCFPVDRKDGRHLFCNNIGELVRHSIYCDYHKQEMIRRQ
jgi:hypothetical protein